MLEASVSGTFNPGYFRSATIFGASGYALATGGTLMRRVLLVLVVSAWALAQTPDHSGLSADGMAGMNMASGHEAPPVGGGAAAMHSMASRHLDMGPHMKMTALRPIQPGDKEKADQVAHAAKAVAERYQDYKVALADGFKIFLPNIPQKQYHFTNYGYAWQARNNFDPSRPTSLLYEKTGDGYKLIGVMYTARKDASEDDLNARIPLSIAQWHAHVNLCLSSKRNQDDVLPQSRKFGLRGSIATKEACDAAGGRFYPQVFGWMVHVYPFEQKAEDIWSVERQHHHMDR
jgi:hypothetical protein